MCLDICIQRCVTTAIDRVSNNMLHITEGILVAMKIRHFENNLIKYHEKNVLHHLKIE